MEYLDQASRTSRIAQPRTLIKPWPEPCSRLSLSRGGGANRDARDLQRSGEPWSWIGWLQLLSKAVVGH